MGNENYSYDDFHADLVKRQIPIYFDLTKKLPRELEEVIEKKDVKHFYGKNIFAEGKKIFTSSTPIK
ncbi:hypothetical protein [Paraliobacillus sediminis]|uniref:hypothetical protein n=1 Tax=Paraliobacillus sediminis TaxID=1885916 RepID=UPI000E3EB842|nr:hypothetical protein [Paraliobacillus sediminis]